LIWKAAQRFSEADASEDNSGQLQTARVANAQDVLETAWGVKVNESNKSILANPPTAGMCRNVIRANAQAVFAIS